MVPMEIISAIGEVCIQVISDLIFLKIWL